MLSARDAALMPPPPPRPRRAVLEEDVFTGCLEGIIERQFFPALPRLRARLGWLAATRTGDEAGAAAAAAMAAGHVGRTPGGAGAPVATPSFGTPSSTPSATPRGAGTGPVAAAEVAASLAAVSSDPSNLSLPSFFAAYTSEDTASFDVQQAERAARSASGGAAAEAARVEAAAARNYALALQPPLPHASTTDVVALDARGVRARDGFGSSGQPWAGVVVGSGRYVVRNALFFPPDTSRVVQAHESGGDGAAVGPPRRVDASATRFHSSSDNDGDPLAPPADDEEAAAVAASAGRGGGGGGGGGVTPFGGPGRVYSRAQTPAPEPGGAGATPLLTWGALGATPLRIGEPDDDGGRAGGPSFRIVPRGARDAAGASLGGRAGASRSRKAAKGGPPRVSAAAAAALLRAAVRGGGLGAADAALRASYTPRGSLAASRGPTPGGTPAGTPAKRARAA